MSKEEIKLPQPDEISSAEKDDAMGAYLMMFAAWAVGLPLPILNLIAAVIYFYVNKKTSRFVAFHALQSLLSQIPVTLINVALIVWLVRNVITGAVYSSGFFILLAVMVCSNILYLIFSIAALVRAKKGNFFYIPFFGRVAFGRYYGPNAVSLEVSVKENRPPEGY
jgi:uncharacterized Tic20 family protein